MRRGKDEQKARNLFAQMTLKEKLIHLWTYYKGHLAAGLVATVILGSLLNAMYTGAQTEHYVHITITEPYAAQLEDAVTQLAQQARWEEGLAVAAASGLEDESGYGVIQWMTSLTAGEVDIAICDEVTAQAIVEEYPTSSLVPLERSALAHVDTGSVPMFIVTLQDTARQEKVQQFSALLSGGGQ